MRALAASQALGRTRMRPPWWSAWKARARSFCVVAIGGSFARERARADLASAPRTRVPRACRRAPRARACRWASGTPRSRASCVLLAGEAGPEMHHRVGAPRTPRLRPLRHARRREPPRAVAERAPKPQVGRREGIGLAQRAHRDVVRRPRADAGDGGEACDRVLAPARGVGHG